MPGQQVKHSRKSARTFGATFKSRNVIKKKLQSLYRKCLGLSPARLKKLFKAEPYLEEAWKIHTENNASTLQELGGDMDRDGVYDNIDWGRKQRRSAYKEPLSRGAQQDAIQDVVWFCLGIKEGDPYWARSIPEYTTKAINKIQKSVDRLQQIIEGIDMPGKRTARKRKLSDMTLVEVQKVWDKLAGGRHLAKGAYYKRAELIKEISRGTN